jgi:hypothetical protein
VKQAAYPDDCLSEYGYCTNALDIIVAESVCLHIKSTYQTTGELQCHIGWPVVTTLLSVAEKVP